MNRGEPDEWLQEWAEHLSAEAYSPRTIHHRVNTLRCISQASGTCPLELTKAHVVAYLTAGDYAPRTRENYLATVRMFCRWAGMEDLTADVRRPRIPRSVPKPVSEADLARLLMTAGQDSREYAWIVLGAYAGLRSAESAAVRAGDLEESGQGWALRVKGKGGVERLVPVPPVVVKVMRGWTDRIAGRGRLWPGATARAVQNAIRAVAVRAEVACSSHQLRHRYGTAVYRASRDLLLTQRLMGHASPSHTAGYAAVVLEEAADVILRLPGADSVAFASGLLSGAAAVALVHAGARA